MATSWRSAGSSNPKTSGRSLRPNYANRKSVCASRSKSNRRRNEVLEHLLACRTKCSAEPAGDGTDGETGGGGHEGGLARADGRLSAEQTRSAGAPGKREDHRNGRAL